MMPFKVIARKQVFLRVHTVKSDVTLATGAVICVIFSHWMDTHLKL